MWDRKHGKLSSYSSVPLSVSVPALQESVLLLAYQWARSDDVSVQRVFATCVYVTEMWIFCDFLFGLNWVNLSNHGYLSLGIYPFPVLIFTNPACKLKS